MKMSRQVWILITLKLSVTLVYAQDEGSAYPLQNRFSIAVFGGELGYDTGFGAEIGSPAFSNNRFSVRLKGNLHFLEQYKADFDQLLKYKSVDILLVYNFIHIDRCRIYVEAGPLLILPDKRISKASYQGLSASGGLEMFVLNLSSVSICYYFSAGFSYSNAIMKNLENQIKYGNGFVFNTGFRFYF